MKELGCQRLHVLAGKLSSGHGLSAAEAEKVYIDNIRYAAERMERDGVTVLIEPINNRSVPGYWLNDPEVGARIVREVQHPNLRLQFDIFHAQIVGGDLTQRIRDWLPLIGHIQIAQVGKRLTLCDVIF
jgi:2-dehydrotetronate isomerase